MRFLFSPEDALVCDMFRDERDAPVVFRLKSEADEPVKDRSGREVEVGVTFGIDTGLVIETGTCCLSWRETGEFGGGTGVTLRKLKELLWSGRVFMVGWPLGGSVIQLLISWLAEQSGFELGSAEKAGSS